MKTQTLIIVVIIIIKVVLAEMGLFGHTITAAKCLTLHALDRVLKFCQNDDDLRCSTGSCSK